ncbi:MAG: ABC transporter substrate-binding protein [Gaiellales bacterium]
MRGPLTLLAPVLVLAVFAVSCGLRSEPTGAGPTYPVVVVDGAGRTVSLPARPTRIASLDAGLTDSLFAVGAGAQVVGRSGNELYPRSALRLPEATSNGAPDMSRLTALHPDLVLAPSSTSQAEASDMARRLGTAVYVAGPPTVDGIEHDILSVSALAGLADRGHDVIGGMRTRINRISSLTRGSPRVPVFVDRGARVTIDPHGIGAALIGLAGGVNAAPGASLDAPYPLARLRRAAPRVYLATPGATTLKALRKSRATRNLPAVRSGRFHIIAPGILVDTGPRITQALAELARLLHPGISIPQGG